MEVEGDHVTLELASLLRKITLTGSPFLMAGSGWQEMDARFSIRTKLPVAMGKNGFDLELGFVKNPKYILRKGLFQTDILSTSKQDFLKLELVPFIP